MYNLLTSTSQKVLPAEYDYKVCEFEAVGDGKFRASLTVAISTQSNLDEWKKAFEDKTKTTYRTSHTTVGKEKTLVFQVSSK